MSNAFKLKISHVSFVNLGCFDDSPDGILFIAEAEKNIPFKIKRVFFINSLGKQQAIRGKHAHKQGEQIIFCISGSFDLILDDGNHSQKFGLEKSTLGFKIGPLVWLTMKNFSPDCVILVLANTYYQEEDYIRDYQQFLKIVHQK